MRRAGPLPLLIPAFCSLPIAVDVNAQAAATGWMTAPAAEHVGKTLSREAHDATETWVELTPQAASTGKDLDAANTQALQEFVQAILEPWTAPGKRPKCTTVFRERQIVGVDLDQERFTQDRDPVAAVAPPAASGSGARRKVANMLIANSVTAVNSRIAEAGSAVHAQVMPL
jgi:hypothetical protein